MMNFNSISKRPRNFMKLIGLSVSQFKELAELERENWIRLTLQSKIPFKKIGIRKELNDLEDLEKEENKRILKERIPVEHAIGRLKKFKILGESYHNSLQNYPNFFKAIAFLTNFRMLSNS